MALPVMDHPEIVLRIGVIGIEPKRRPLVSQRFIRTSLPQNREAQIHPGLLEVRVERQGVSVKRLCLHQPILAM